MPGTLKTETCLPKLKEYFTGQLKLLLELEELGELPDEIEVSDMLLPGRDGSADLMMLNKKVYVGINRVDVKVGVAEGTVNAKSRHSPVFSSANANSTVISSPTIRFHQQIKNMYLVS